MFPYTPNIQITNQLIINQFKAFNFLKFDKYKSKPIITNINTPNPQPVAWSILVANGGIINSPILYITPPDVSTLPAENNPVETPIPCIVISHPNFIYVGIQ